MQPISFDRLGKTIVLSDLHMHSLWGEFERAQETRVRHAIDAEEPKTIILNGDTFDLFFSITDPVMDIGGILKTNHSLVELLNRTQNLYILAGAHDQAIRWDNELRQVLRGHLPNCRGFHDGLMDDSCGIVIVPGSQWYYDNVVRVNGNWLSLTRALTAAFQAFLLSGVLNRQALQAIYMSGKMSFWYRTGSHYEFLRGLSRTFECRIDQYFQRLASMIQQPDFSEWADRQFYEEHRAIAHLAALATDEAGLLLEKLAVQYWKMLGRVVNARLNEYLRAGKLEYPPYTGIRFDTGVVGHTHLTRVLGKPRSNGRGFLFIGSTKAQTRIVEGTDTAQNECGGGYVVISDGSVSLERFEVETSSVNLRSATELWTQSPFEAT